MRCLLRLVIPVMIQSEVLSILAKINWDEMLVDVGAPHTICCQVTQQRGGWGAYMSSAHQSGS